MKSQFLRHVLPLMFIFCGFIDISAADLSNVSKADILATVRHMQALAAEQKVALAKADADFQKQASDLSKAESEAKLMAAAAHANAKERDVVILVASILSALYFGSMVAGVPMREFPTPWNLVAAGAFYVLIFSFSYAAGRLFLHAVASLVP